MIRDIKLLKEEIKKRKRLNVITIILLLALVVTFYKILLVIPASMLVLSIPASIVHGIKDGIKCVLYYSRLYLWDYLFYNNYLRIKEIKKELEN